MKRFIVMFIILTLILTGVIISCAKKEPDVIKIGAVLSQTGVIAPYGQSAVRGLELAIYEINNSGGINGKNIEIILEDAKSDPASATLAVQKLIHQDEIKIVVGFIGSSLLLATAPLFNENEVVLISPGASSPQIRNAGEFVFRTRASGHLEAITLAKYAINNLNHNKIAVIYINNDYGLSWLNSFTDQATSLGAEIVAKEAFEQGTTDVRNQLTKIKISHPSCLLILGYLNEIATTLKQLKQLGLKVNILTTVGVQDEKIFDLVGESSDGVYFSAVDYNPRVDSVSMNFDKAYSEKFGESSNIFAANAYDAMYLIRNAVEKVGLNSTMLKEFLLSMDVYHGAGGTLHFDEKGDIIKPVQIKQIKGNDFIIIE